MRTKRRAKTKPLPEDLYEGMIVEGPLGGKAELEDAGRTDAGEARWQLFHVKEQIRGNGLFTRTQLVASGIQMRIRNHRKQKWKKRRVLA